MDVKLVLFFFVLFVAHLTCAQNRCNNASVVACVQNLQQFELDEYDAIVPTFTEQELSTLCGSYQQSSSCLNGLISDCSVYDQFYFAAIEDNWDYICNREKDGYLQHRECLAKDRLHSRADELCTDTWEARVQTLNRNKFRNVDGNLNTAGLSSLCNYANDYLSCIYSEVEAECNAAAAAWQRGFDDTLIQPLLGLIGCTKGQDNQGQSFYSYPGQNQDKGIDDAIIIIVVVAIALGVLVMVIIAILLIRQNKKRRGRPDHLDHGPPGPYVMYGADAQSIAMGGAAAPSVMAPPSYKEKGDLGPEFGIPMPPPPTYGAPPSYRPAESVYQGGGAPSVMSGHTNRTSRSHRSHGSHRPSENGRMSSNASGYMNPSSGYIT